MRQLQSGNRISSESSANTQDTVSVLLERIKELENEGLVLQQLVDSKEVEIDKLQNSVQNIEAEKETSQMQNLLDALSKVTYLEEHSASRDQTIIDLEHELEISKSQGRLADELEDILSLKNNELTNRSEACKRLEEELAKLQQSSYENVTNEEKKYKEELKKKEEVFESHSKFMKSKVYDEILLIIMN